jgi:hypothetical protein
MTKLMLAAVVVAVVTLLAACATHSATSPASAAPKITDWGTIVITNGVPGRHALADGRVCADWGTIVMTNGVPSRHALADGRVCTVTVTPLAIGAKLVVALPQTNSAGVVYPYSIGQQTQMTLAVEETNSAGAVHSYGLSSDVLLDQPLIIAFDQTNLINFTVRIAQ